MADAEDPHVALVHGEQYAVIAESQAEGTRHVPMQRRNIAAAGTSVVENSIEDAHGGVAIETADVNFGRIGPFDAIGRH